MQRFTYTLLLLIATLTYTACVSGGASDNTPEKVPAPVIVEKPTPKPEPAPPPPIVEKKPTPPPAPKPPVKTQQTTPPPTPKPAPQPKPAPVPKPINTTQNVTPPPPPPPPRTGGGIMIFDDRTFDYGYIEEGDVIDHIFKFKNTGTTAINILRAEASCGCTHPTYSFLEINPGETGEIGARFNSTGKLGKSTSTITLLTDARPTKQELFLTGTVIPPRKEEKEGKKEDSKEEKDDESKEEEKNDEKDTKTGESKTDAKPDSLNFKPRGPRKLPKGIPPKTQKDEDDTGKN